MKIIAFFSILLTFLQTPVYASEWGRHQGGSGVNPDVGSGEEKGDALYRKTSLWGLTDNYHAAIFTGLEIGNPGGVPDTPYLRVIEKQISDSCCEKDINYIRFVAECKTAGVGGGYYSFHGMGQTMIYPKNGPFVHTVANMDALSEALRWGWGKLA